MKKTLTLLAALFVVTVGIISVTPAHAGPGAAGFPKVIDGGKLRFGFIEVELFGVRLPEPGMICRVESANVEFSCDAAATQALARLISDYAVKCRQVSDMQLFPMLTECSLGQSDLTRLLLRDGWAMVDMNSCPGNPNCQTYLDDQAYAKEQHKGMWIGTPPEKLVALASLPSDDDTPDERMERFAQIQAPFKVDLAAEMAKKSDQGKSFHQTATLEPTRERKTDTTLLSYLERTPR